MQSGRNGGNSPRKRQTSGDGSSPTAVVPGCSGSGEGPSSRKRSRDDGATLSDMETTVADGLTCAICASMLFECVSVWPCMHSFCGGCLSQWAFDRNKTTCPQCRGPFSTDKVRMNPQIGGMVDALLQKNPRLQTRTPEEREEMSARNWFKPSAGNVPVPAPLARPRNRRASDRSLDIFELGWQDMSPMVSAFDFLRDASMSSPDLPMRPISPASSGTTVSISSSDQDHDEGDRDNRRSGDSTTRRRRRTRRRRADRSASRSSRRRRSAASRSPTPFAWDEYHRSDIRSRRRRRNRRGSNSSNNRRRWTSRNSGGNSISWRPRPRSTSRSRSRSRSRSPNRSRRADFPTQSSSSSSLSSISSLSSDSSDASPPPPPRTGGPAVNARRGRADRSRGNRGRSNSSDSSPDDRRTSRRRDRRRRPRARAGSPYPSSPSSPSSSSSSSGSPHPDRGGRNRAGGSSEEGPVPARSWSDLSSLHLDDSPYRIEFSPNYTISLGSPADLDLDEQIYEPHPDPDDEVMAPQDDFDYDHYAGLLEDSEPDPIVLSPSSSYRFSPDYVVSVHSSNSSLSTPDYGEPDDEHDNDDEREQLPVSSPSPSSAPTSPTPPWGYPDSFPSFSTPSPYYPSEWQALAGGEGFQGSGDYFSDSPARDDGYQVDSRPESSDSSVYYSPGRWED